MPLDDWQKYQLSLKYQRDLKNTEDAIREQGRIEEKQRIVHNLIQSKELSDEQIASVSGLSLAEIRRLRQDQEKGNSVEGYSAV